ncbi:Orn/Lys/Arg decarboxylase N-terminal domain-containing protein [Thermopolyspora sp. NPDC052614]|uniref:Orn/Lys/Arg family decarboxylase n=1 Tax=Thermopolyspora sp. NPDC052614 TaxID=3155682 RepID=UPI00343CC053
MERTVLAAVTERPDADSALAEQLRRVCAEMGDLGLQVRWTHRAEDALAVVGSDASLTALLAAWDAPGAEELLRAVRGRFRGLPVFLMTREQELPLWVYEVIQGYQAMIRARTERVPLAELPGRVAAATVVVTPPGIPMLMPGEAAGPADGPLVTYLRALEDFDRVFPDLATDIHGAHRDGEGRYWVEVLRS